MRSYDIFHNLRNLIGTATFYIINIILAPVTLTGYLIWVGKGFLTRNKPGVSGRAQGPLSARWFEHNLGTRQDEPANRLMKVLPGMPPLGMRMVSGPLLLAHRLTGFVPRAFAYCSRVFTRLRIRSSRDLRRRSSFHGCQPLFQIY